MSALVCAVALATHTTPAQVRDFDPYDLATIIQLLHEKATAINDG